MAKSKFRNTRANRGFANNALLSLRPSINPFSIGVIPDDRRTFHPDQSTRFPRASLSYANNIGVSRSAKNKSRRFPFAVGFKSPSRVYLCVRRKVRREVMFAKSGAGSRRMRRPKRNYYSDVRC